MKIITLEDYQEAGKLFWDKYWYVSKELGEGARTEDIITVMETLAGVVLSLREEKEEESTGPFGFNKKDKKDKDDETTVCC